MNGSQTHSDLRPDCLNLPSPVTRIHSSLLLEKNIQLYIKRDELIHPVIQGNKWRKLKYNLLEAKKSGKNTLLSFGGAYSNHLHALAAAGKLYGFNTIGIIRGEAPAELNPSLRDMLEWNMQLEFIRRIDYKQKTSAAFAQKLKHQFGDVFLIPEGGNNPAGIKGCGELLHELDDIYDHICCEVGSGTMLSSLILHNQQANTRFTGFAVMKNQQLEQDIKHTLSQHPAVNTQWQLNHDYHFGGFAKTDSQLNDFIKDFKRQHDVQLEPVYSGKMLYGILDLVKNNHYKPGTKILAIHGGGLQGLRGFADLRQE